MQKKIDVGDTVVIVGTNSSLDGREGFVDRVDDFEHEDGPIVVALSSNCEKKAVTVCTDFTANFQTQELTLLSEGTESGDLLLQQCSA